MTRRSLAALCLLAAGPALAQDAFSLAPFALDAVTPSTRTFDVRVQGGEGPSIGTITETVRLEGDVLTVVTVAEVPQAGPTRTDSTRMAWPGLDPLSDHFTAGDNMGTAVYADGGVTGTFGALPFDFTFDTPRYASAAIPLLVQAIPLEEGFEATVPTFGAQERYREAELEVTGRERVEAPDGSEVSAWVVRQVGGGGITGQFPKRHYVDPDSRALLRTVFTAGGMEIALVPMTAEMMEARGAEQEAAAAAAEAARASASELRPGDAPLVTDALATEDVAMTVKLVQPMQQDAGTETRSLVVDAAAGTVTLTTETVIALAGQRMEATYVAAYPSLAPISVRQDDGSDVTELAFADGRVTGTADGEPVDLSLEAPVFVNSWQPVLVTLLPFEEGYSAVLHGYSSGDGVVETLLTVTGREDVDGRAAWVVTAERDDDPTLTYKVDAETRALLSYGLAPQPGVEVVFVRDAE